MSERPPLTIRIAVVIAAVACLGLAMCVSQQRQVRPDPPAPRAEPFEHDVPAQQAVVPPRNTKAPARVKPTAPPPQAATPPDPEPRYFPATKAAGPIE
jgi:hypothetical protein